MLMGHLTRDVELKFTQSNTAIANFGLAVSRKWKDNNGESKEEVLFVDCECWGKGGETLAKYVGKGKPLFIEGRLKLDQWEKDGKKHSKIKVVVENFQFVGGKDDAEKPVDSKPASKPVARPQRQAAAPQMGEDDIPFD